MSHDNVAPAHLDQALHDLYLSHERGEADYAPRPNGWRSLAPFRDLVTLGEARTVNRAPFSSFRITLLGLVVVRRMLEDKAA
jgi:hypothetical protein